MACLSYVLGQNHQTTHSLLFSFPHSFLILLCLHLRNMIQQYPMLHFLPWPTFAPTASCDRASRPVPDCISDGRDISAIRICTNSSNTPTIICKDVMLYFPSTGGEPENRCEVFANLGRFAYPWLSAIKHLCLHWTIFPGLWRFFLSCPEGWLSFSITL